jgi:phytoene dehydrogenase-like protein
MSQQEGKTQLETSYDVIIVGAGIGGLICGAALAKAGKKVLVCEQHFQPGGYVSSFQREGFTFDAGVQSFSSSGVVFPILKELGLYNKLQFARADYRIITPDINVKLNSLPQVREEFKRAFPKAENEVGAYFQDLEALLRPFRKMLAGAKPSLPLLSGARRATAMFSFPFTNFGFIKNMKRYQKTTSVDLTEQHLTDSKAKFILSSLGYPIMSTMTTVGMWYSWLEDYWYPIGGMQNFANLFADSIEDNGGIMTLRTKVDRIMVENDMAAGVRLANGTEIRSKFVVSNIDWRQTFTRLIDRQYLEGEFLTQIEKAKVSEAMFCVYLGVDLDKSSLGGLAHHVFYFPAYGKPFLERDANDSQFFRDCGVEISLPSLVDDSLAPKAKSVVTLTTMAPYNYLNYWGTEHGKRTEAYGRLKEEIAEQLIAIAESIIPDLSKHIMVKEIATPLTYERYTLNSEGATVGWSWDPKHALTTKCSSSVGSLRTPVKNLFTVGHWCYCPGGVPSAMLTARMVADIIKGAHQG